MRLINKSIFAFILSASSIANAALIDRDWAFDNDNFLMHDTSTNLLWLDLSITADQSYNNIADQFGAGEYYEGFRYATLDEVLHLWSEAGITDTNFAWVDNGEVAAVSSLANRLGTSLLADSTGIGAHALGMINGGEPLPNGEHWVMELSYNFDGIRTRTSSNYYTLDPDYNSIHYSSYLVKISSVPLPGSLLMLLSGIISLTAFSLKK